MYEGSSFILENKINFKEAKESDVEKIVEMLADDFLGSEREDYKVPLPASYINAFRAIESDPNNELIVAWMESEIVGVQQITFTPYITRQGGWRATIEGVRVSASFQGKGIGTELIRWAINRAKDRGCHLVQLTTDKRRTDSLGFYEKLGFKASHEGLKMTL